MDVLPQLRLLGLSYLHTTPSFLPTQIQILLPLPFSSFLLLCHGLCGSLPRILQPFPPSLLH